MPIDEGTRVIDGDDNPNTPVVVWRPEAKTTADWIYEAGRETYTIAESNSTYLDDDQLIVVVFERRLEDAWPEWTAADPDDLYEKSLRMSTEAQAASSRHQPPVLAVQTLIRVQEDHGSIVQTSTCTGHTVRP